MADIQDADKFVGEYAILIKISTQLDSWIDRLIASHSSGINDVSFISHWHV